VRAVFSGVGIAGLSTNASIDAALGRLRNVLAELGCIMPCDSSFRGRRSQSCTTGGAWGAWMERRWRRKDPTVSAVVLDCRQLVTDRGLQVTYLHQRGHQSTWAGRDDYARWNARTDELADEGRMAPR
jgi:hypothetical protein